VMRNYAAGSLCRRLGVEEGLELVPPTFELFFKDDSLGDPMVNESQAIALGWANAEQLAQMKELTQKVTVVLTDLFAQGNMLLVDFKLEFGVFHD
ncbi:phosphoribosylaminoimidazolesuccinocarboxamide synthase, partial [Acinetobacter guillouiae]|uniref:phosphoribosylaminoimidazolesuccinocarboxamide synthase n=1 Tax=Acinetobacter guillouiae TaxID=106649 RepID=UPI003AF8E4D4